MADKRDKVAVRPGRVDRGGEEETFIPLVDVYETPDGTTMLLAELPGATNETLDIRVDKGVLTLAAVTALDEPGEDYAATYTGFREGKYFRAFALSDEIDREQIEATLANGLLTLRMPRAAAARTRKIEVRED